MRASKEFSSSRLNLSSNIVCIQFLWFFLILSGFDPKMDRKQSPDRSNTHQKKACDNFQPNNKGLKYKYLESIMDSSRTHGFQAKNTRWHY